MLRWLASRFSGTSLESDQVEAGFMVEERKILKLDLLFGSERESGHQGGGILDLNGDLLGAEKFMPRGERVFAGGKIWDGEFTVGVSYGEEGVIHYPEMSGHPAVKVALDRDGAFRFLKDLLAVGGAGWLHDVEDRVGS